MKLQDCMKFCEMLIESDADITAKQMAERLHNTGYDIDACASALARFFSSTSLDEVCVILINEYNHPLVSSSNLSQALILAKYDETSVQEVVARNYPADVNRYALQLESGSVNPYAQCVDAYNVGTGDFTVEAWVKTTNAGTVVSRKSGEGGTGYGGFLLVIKPEGIVKFATDDGCGFYEVNSVATNILDGKWHHISGIRKECELSIVLDFAPISVTPRTDRFAELNINNGMRLMIGGTDQWQEPYNQYTGLVGEVRLWSCKKTYTDSLEWDHTDKTTAYNIGMWSFFDKQGVDVSPTGNPLVQVAGDNFMAWDMP